jgi:hypothetical protein
MEESTLSQAVPIPINRSGAVPTPINFRESEIGAAQTTILEKKEKFGRKSGPSKSPLKENKDLEGDNVYFLIITFGFLLAMRGARPAPLQRPLEGLRRIAREGTDLFLTTGLILALLAFAAGLEEIRAAVREYAVLVFGVAAYLLSRYQKKTDVFFLTVTSTIFMICSKQHGLSQELLLAWVVSAGIVIFQACFLGLRHRLLFSPVPASMRGWPSLCLLAGFISIILWSLWNPVF